MIISRFENYKSDSITDCTFKNVHGHSVYGCNLIYIVIPPNEMKISRTVNTISQSYLKLVY